MPEKQHTVTEHHGKWSMFSCHFNVDLHQWTFFFSSIFLTFKKASLVCAGLCK